MSELEIDRALPAPGGEPVVGLADLVPPAEPADDPAAEPADEPGLGVAGARLPFWPTLLAVTGFALAIRVVYVLVFTSREAPRIYDSLWYNAEAVYMTRGHFFPVIFGHGPSAAHPPLTSLAIVPATYLFGFHAGEVPQRLTMAVLGVVVVVLVGLLGRSVAGPRVGIVAAVLASVYPNMWMPNGIVMSETLSMLLMALILLGVYRLLREPTAWHAALVGLACGLEILDRAELALFVPLILIPAALACRTVRWRRRVGLAGLGVAVCLVTVMPWVGRNLVSFHDTTLVSTGEGLVLLGANCPQTYYGADIGTWSLRCAQPPGLSGDESERSAERQQRATHYVSRHESRLPVVMVARVARLWDLYMPVQMARDDVAEGRPEGAALAGLVMYYALLPLAGLGMAHLRRRRLVQWPLLVPAVALTVVAALSYGIVRFRAPFEVCLVILAAAGIDAVAGWHHRRRATRSVREPQPDRRARDKVLA
ncbi:MAG: ArnT family glycosyltransferase [Acidimicrobiales bacterium]